MLLNKSFPELLVPVLGDSGFASLEVLIPNGVILQSGGMKIVPLNWKISLQVFNGSTELEDEIGPF